MDSWTPKQLKCMQLGGNNSLSEFLASYDLMSEPMDVRYQTKAAEYYRKKLRAFWNDEEFHDVKPDYEEGRMSIEYKSKSQEELKQSFGAGARSQDNNQGLDKAKVFLNDFWTGTKNVTSKSYNYASTKIQESGVGEKVSTGAKTVGTKTVEYGGIALNKTKEGIFKIATNEKVQEFGSKAYTGVKDAGSSVWGFFSKALNKSSGGAGGAQPDYSPGS